MQKIALNNEYLSVARIALLLRLEPVREYFVQQLEELQWMDASSQILQRGKSGLDTSTVAARSALISSRVQHSC